MSTIQVESFVPDEVAEVATDPVELDTIRTLSETLGLRGQLNLATPSETRTSPLVFPVAELKMLRIIHILCPEETSLSTYEAELLPIRVLELAKQAHDAGLTKLTVFHPVNVKDDPFLIGQVKAYDKSHLICRWGAHLKSWAELEKDAVKIAYERALTCSAELSTLITTLKAGILPAPASSWNTSFKPSLAGI